VPNSDPAELPFVPAARTRARVRLALAIGVMLLVRGPGLAQEQGAPSPAPSPPAKLTGHAAIDALIGNTMTGTAEGAPYFAYYDKNGEVRMQQGRDVSIGHWSIDRDDLCEEYPEDDDETCYKLELDGAEGVMTDEDGTAYAIEIIPGNPRKL
jgi:hypothetical protein